MRTYIIRLDDASEYMDLQKWTRMEKLLDHYGVKPIFGIIPKNSDGVIVPKYEQNPEFWDLMHSWISKGWTPAMHGYEHKYVTEEGGLNPVNSRSEFAGLPYEEQATKIREGYRILLQHGIKTNIFFAPSHTFDENTLEALKKETPIRIISDTVANSPYSQNGFTFIPQQSGSVRNLPFNTVTFCYHPNVMKDKDFENLSDFLNKNKRFFTDVPAVETTRKMNCFDKLIRWMYFARR